MSNTNLILEALFTGADEAECARRDKEAQPILQKEWMDDFLKGPYATKNSDGSYDVDGNVDMSKINFGKIPLKFNVVNGSFYCDGCGLTTLENAPKIVRGSFWATHNLLTTLKESPKEVRGNYVVHNNKLTSLEGAPEYVEWNFNVWNNAVDFTEDDVRNHTKVGYAINVTHKSRMGQLE